MARNKQTTSTSHANRKTHTSGHCFHFRDTGSDCCIHLYFHGHIYANGNTDAVLESGETKSTTNSGRYSILTYSARGESTRL